ncbi:MAG: peptidoglycan-binding protein [Actinomycetota bacterium]|nr:peptidoglycan-binding protein [Actinomycetota bacterium]
MGKRSRVSRIVLIAAAVIAALGWGGWRALSNRQPSGPADGDASVHVTAGVQVRTLERTVATRGVVGYAARETLIAAGSGRVTSVRVSLGSVVESGKRVLEIDGRPAVAVEGSKPLWRDLAIGVVGPDVARLQRVLEADGYLSFAPDGRFGGATRAALEAWQEDHGFPVPDGVLRVDDWLVADWPRRVGQVHVRIGGFVHPGSELLTLTDQDPAVSIELTPSDRLRVRRGDRARVEVAATALTIEGAVRAVEVTPQTLEDGSLVYPGTLVVDEPLDVPQGTQVSVTIIVERAKDVLVVPLASLVSDSEGGPAVVVTRPDGSLETVSIELGLSEGAWTEVVSGLSGDETVLVAR